jgi:iron complex transport system ATP-binding protein
LLDDVSLAVPAGRLCALVGPNGAGKSTLIHVLAGDRRPTAGSVIALGRPLASWSPAEIAKVRAVLPQESTLSFPFTALEVVVLGRSPHIRLAETELDLAIARGALRLVAASHLEDRAYPTLSGGERQRVQLARAVAQVSGLGDRAPRILLLDEPTSSLDPAHQHGTLQLARSLAREGATVLAVLHDLNLAAQYADTIAVLEAGRIRASGPPAEVLEEGLLGQVFGVPMRVTRAPWDPARLLVAVHAPDASPLEMAFRAL